MTEMKLTIKPKTEKGVVLIPGWYVAKHFGDDRLIYVTDELELYVFDENNSIAQHYGINDFTMYQEWKRVDKITIEVE